MTTAPSGPTQQVYYVERKLPQPTVTIGLLVVNIAVFLLELLLPNQVNPRLGLNWFLAREEPWRIVTSGFVHFDILHIGLNMLGLWLLGRPLEISFGHLRFALLYALSLLGGSAMDLLLTRPSASPDAALRLEGGASGALFGLFGTLLVMQAHKLIQASGLLPILALNLGISFLLPNIGWQAHLGGLLIGSGVAWAYVRGLRRDVSPKGMWIEVGAIAGIVMAMLLAAYLL